MNTERPDNPADGTDPAPGDADRAAPDAPVPPASATTPDAPSAPASVPPADASGGDDGPAEDGAGDAGAAAGPAPGSGTGASDGRDRRRSPVLVAAVAAAVLVAGGGGAYLAATAGGGPDGSARGTAPGAQATPPPLVLDDLPVAAPSGTAGIAPGEPNPYGVTYRARGDLPAGPGSASVYRPAGEVGKARVARLAEALGVEGTPVADGRFWRVGSGNDGTGPFLRVNRQAPGAWTFERYAPGADDCRKADVCAQGSADPAPGPVDAGTARRAVAPVLKALGQGGARLGTDEVTGARRTVTADPVVGGLPTEGWTTSLTVGGQGDVVRGDGLLKSPVRGDTYPVLDAARTLALLNAAPGGGHRMGIGGCAVPVAPRDRLERPCGTSPSPGATGRGTATGPARATAAVEKAVFGLASHSVGGRQTLVPSWLFQVRDSGGRDAYTVTYPALDPMYLASPSGSSAGEPTPASPSASSAAPRTRDVRVTGYTADGKELTVGFTGGVCADYSVSARENGDRVRVTVTEKPWPDRICILIAKEYREKIRLDEPLGSREVTGSDGTPVPRDTSATHLPEPSSQPR